MEATATRVQYLTDEKTLVEVLREEEDGRLLVANVATPDASKTGYITKSQRHKWREVTPDGSE